MNFVEAIGYWPESVLISLIALIPKGAASEEVTATDLRPISVMSLIYRLWASTRFRLCMKWQEEWIDEA